MYFRYLHYALFVIVFMMILSFFVEDICFATGIIDKRTGIVSLQNNCYSKDQIIKTLAKVYVAIGLVILGGFVYRRCKK